MHDPSTNVLEEGRSRAAPSRARPRVHTWGGAPRALLRPANTLARTSSQPHIWQTRYFIFNEIDRSLRYNLTRERCHSDTSTTTIPFQEILDVVEHPEKPTRFLLITPVRAAPYRVLRAVVALVSPPLIEEARRGRNARTS